MAGSGVAVAGLAADLPAVPEAFVAGFVAGSVDFGVLAALGDLDAGALVVAAACVLAAFLLATFFVAAFFVPTFLAAALPSEIRDLAADPVAPAAGLGAADFFSLSALVAFFVLLFAGEADLVGERVRVLGAWVVAMISSIEWVLAGAFVGLPPAVATQFVDIDSIARDSFKAGDACAAGLPASLVFTSYPRHAETDLEPTHPPSLQQASDAALIARLYELARARVGNAEYDRAELEAIDAMVYGRLARNYGEKWPPRPDDWAGGNDARFN